MMTLFGQTSAAAISRFRIFTSLPRNLCGIQFRLLPLVFLAFLLAAARPVYAHGEDGTQNLDGVSVGHFALTVWSFPATLRVGEVHFSAAVIQPADGTPVVNSDVVFQVTPLHHHGEASGGERLIAAAGPANVTTGFMHEAVLRLETPGPYLVNVRVTNPVSGLDGTADFEIFIQSPSVFLKWLIIGLGIFTIVVVIWYVYEGILVWRHRHLAFGS